MYNQLSKKQADRLRDATEGIVVFALTYIKENGTIKRNTIKLDPPLFFKNEKTAKEFLQGGEEVYICYRQL